MLFIFFLTTFQLLGQCKQDNGYPQTFTNTLTGQKVPVTFQSSSPYALYVTSMKVNLLNGDSCPIGQHVIV